MYLCAFAVLRFGTEMLYAQKEDLLHEVLELEAEKGLLASGESAKYQVGVSGVVLAEKSRYVILPALEVHFHRGCFSGHELV